MSLTDAQKKEIIERENLKMQMEGKNPIVAILLSVLLTGLGDIYCGNWGRGIILACCYFVSWLLCLAFIGIFTTPIIWVIGLASAWISAESSKKEAIQKLANSQ